MITNSGSLISCVAVQYEAHDYILAVTRVDKRDGGLSCSNSQRTTQFGGDCSCVRLNGSTSSHSGGTKAVHAFCPVHPTVAIQDETRVKAVQAGATGSLVAIMQSCQDAIFQVRCNAEQILSMA
jgi:hypothetical protein